MGKQVEWIVTSMAGKQSRSGFLRQAAKLTLGGAALLGGSFAGLALPEVAMASGCCGATTCSSGCPSGTNVTTQYSCCPPNYPCGAHYQTCFSCYYCSQTNPPSGCTLLCQYCTPSGIVCPCTPSRT